MKNTPTVEQMNKATGKKRLKLFADYIESKQHDRMGSLVKPDAYFCMDAFRYSDCGTPSCIAGHAAFISEPSALKGTYVKVNSIIKAASKWMGIADDDEANLLFVPGLALRQGEKTFNLTKITPKRAADAIRRFADGERDVKKLWKGAPRHAVFF